MRSPIHDVMQQDVVVEYVRREPLWMFSLLRLFLLAVQLGKLLHWVLGSAGHHQDHWEGGGVKKGGVVRKERSER